MSLPVPKAFSTEIEVRFPDNINVPSEMKEWCSVTRENLDRLKEKVLILESTEIAILRKKVKQLEDQIKGL
jgi:hypothetical protein